MELKDGNTLFTIKNLSSDNAGDKNVVFEFKANPGHFLTGGQAQIDARSDCLNCKQNVFKLIKNPQISDEPSCEGEACGDVFIDRIVDTIFWTNTGDRTIYIQRPDYGAIAIEPHERANGDVFYWSKWYVLYKLKEPPPPPSPPKPAPPPQSNNGYRTKWQCTNQTVEAGWYSTMYSTSISCGTRSQNNQVMLLYLQDAPVGSIASICANSTSPKVGNPKTHA